MLNLPAVLDPVQVVERRGLRIEKAFAHEKDEISLPQDLVNLGVLEDKARFGKDTGFVLKTDLLSSPSQLCWWKLSADRYCAMLSRWPPSTTASK